MKIFANKPYTFTSPTGEVFEVPAKVLAFMPDWVRDTELFQLAVTNGNIKVIGAPALQELREEAKALGIPRAMQMGEKKLTEAIAAVKEGEAVG